MVEVVVSDEKKVTNVSVAGEKLSLCGEVVSLGSGNKVERICLRVQENGDADKYVGDVSYVLNHDERDTASFFVNCLQEHVDETVSLGIEAVKSIVNPKNNA